MKDDIDGGGAERTPEPDEVTSVTQAGASAADEAAPADSAADEATATAAVPADEVTKAMDVPADEATTKVDAAGGEASAAALVPARRPSRLRRILVGLLVFLSCLAVVVTGLTIWAHYTVMNTDGYMNLVGPIGKDPEAIKNLSGYVGDQAVIATDLQQRVADALPQQAQFFAGPITSAVSDFITKGAQKVLSSPKAYDLWLKINRLAHEKIVALLRGESTNAYVAGSDVKLNLLPLISQVLVWVDDRLPGGLADKFSPPVIEPGTDPQTAIQDVANWSGKPLPSDFGQVTLLQSDALGPAQTAVKWFDRLVWILPLVTLGLVALTIWLSRRRGRTAIAIGIGAAIAIVLTRVIINRASIALTDKLKEGGGLHVAKDVVNASLGPLTTITIWIVIIGVVAAILVWFLGRRDLRNAAVSVGKRAVSGTGDVKIPDSPVTSWIGNHVLAVRWGVLVVGLLVLVLFAWSWLWIFLIVIIVLLFQAVLSLISGQWPFEEKASDESASA
jgi:hypothetical protein